MAIANRTCVSFCNQPKAHFGLPWVRPWDNRGEFTWMKRGFNAGQTHSSIYSSIFNRLRAIARYWSEIATFSYPLHLTPLLGCSHWNSGKKFGPQKTRIMGLPGSEDSLTTGWVVSTQYQRVTDRRTDGQTSSLSTTCAVWLTHVNKIGNKRNVVVVVVVATGWRRWSGRAKLRL